MSADPAVRIKFAEIDASLRNFRVELHATSIAVSDFLDAKLKVQALLDRYREIRDDIAILKEMQGVR